eukprot:TRINITY_DN10708_c0_g1_i2.p1 TRINITY_DN10708_c0_g1~~TRINITY_DN10708_c0_g1_i2.p1  ORF type:complete len:408 (-),score=79.83 TRINITY_DN10708_c0_g1_i2:197-1420(-)
MSITRSIHKGYSSTYFYLVLISLFSILAPIHAQIANGLPLVVEAPHYNVTFTPSLPYCVVTTLLPNTTQPTPIISAFVSGYREVQLPISALNYSTGDEFTASVMNKSIIISNYTFHHSDTNFTSTLVNRSSGNAVGVQSNYTLPNSATVYSTFTINPLSSFTVPIPRPEYDRFNCTLKNPNTFTPNCVCQQDHSIDRWNIKLAIGADNWPFAPLPNSSYFSAWIVTLRMVGPWNLDYYIGRDVANFATFNVCDVAVAPFNMSGGNVIIPLSLFTNYEADGGIKPISVLFDMSAVEFQPDGLVVFPFQFLFYSFNKSVYWDPDFSILIKGVNDGGDLGGGGAGDGGDKNGSGKSSTYGVVLAVVLPVAFVAFVLVGLVAIGGFIFYRKRQSKSTLNKLTQATNKSEEL